MEIMKITKTKDFKAIAEIYPESWKFAYRGIVPQSYLDSLSADHWMLVLSDNKYDTYAIADDEKYIGTASICPARDEKMKGWGEIISIYFLPQYFGKGYSEVLFNAAIEALVDKGFKDIYLWVLDENIRAQKFYEKNGFKKSSDTIQTTIEGKDLKEVRYVCHLD